MNIVCSRWPKRFHRVYKAKRLPQHGPDYEFLQVSEWWRLENAFKYCAKFEPELRPSAHNVTAMLSKGKSFSASVEHVVSLQVSQASSLGEQDKIAAECLNSSNAISIEYENEETAEDNDRTNSCAFLGLEIANRFLASKESLEWSELKTTAEDVINNYPIVIIIVINCRQRRIVRTDCCLFVDEKQSHKQLHTFRRIRQRSNATRIFCCW